MFNWNKVYNDGDISYLSKTRVGTLSEYYKVYDILMNDYIKEFGLSKKQKRLNRLKYQLLKLNISYIETGNRMILNKINLLEKEINQMNLLFFKQNSSDFNEFLVILQKWYGQKISLKETSVLEFHSIVRVYERANKKRRDSGSRRTK